MPVSSQPHLETAALTSSSDNDTLWHSWRQRNHAFLEKQLQNIATTQTQPPPLIEAMQYSLLKNGGQRWRPLLVYAIAHQLQVPFTYVDPAAAAIECIHAYSLIHDDLPSMDDDDFRRNMPSCHRVFGEATAILAGDCLSNLAFSILSQPMQSSSAATMLKPQQQLDMIRCLSQAAGANGMAYGQALDLVALQADQQNTQPVSQQQIHNIHRYKTGCLFAASCQLSSIAANHNVKQQAVYANFGELLGVAYQMQDDIDDANDDQQPQQGSINIVHHIGFPAAQQSLEHQQQHIHAQAKALDHDTQLLQDLCTAILKQTITNA